MSTPTVQLLIDRTLRNRVFFQGGSSVMDAAGVSWHGAKDYYRWLGEQTGLPVDLPTEAQWEYAVRSRGKLVPFATDTGLIEYYLQTYRYLIGTL